MPTVSINQGMALASFDFLRCVIATRTACFGGLGALAVHYRGARCGFATDAFAIQHQQVMVDCLPGAVVAEPGKPGVGRLVRRKMLGQHAPRAAPAQDEEDRVDDFTHRPAASASGSGG